MLTKILTFLCLGLFGAPAAFAAPPDHDCPCLTATACADPVPDTADTAAVTVVDVARAPDQVAAVPIMLAALDAIVERPETRTALDPADVYATMPREPDRWKRHAISPDSGAPMDNRPLAPPNRLA